MVSALGHIADDDDDDDKVRWMRLVVNRTLLPIPWDGTWQFYDVVEKNIVKILM